MVDGFLIPPQRGRVGKLLPIVDLIHTLNLKIGGSWTLEIVCASGGLGALTKSGSYGGRGGDMT